MGLETASYLNGLDAANPAMGDPKSQGDDHIRLIKAVLLATFPNLAGAVTPTQAELNFVDGVTSAIQGQLDVLTAAVATKLAANLLPNLVSAANPTTAELNYLVGVTSAIQGQLDALTAAVATKLAASLLPNLVSAANPTAAELNYLVGVTSAVQTQLNAKLAASLFPNVNAAANPSDEELNYLVGVTSALQTQLNAKATRTSANTFSAADNVFLETLAVPKGIQVGTTLSASDDVLDYYKEATTTPPDFFTYGTYASITYNSRTRRQVRIGREVFAEYFFFFSSKSGSGNACITNWDTSAWNGWTTDVAIGTWVADTSTTPMGGLVFRNAANGALYMLKSTGGLLQFNDTLTTLSLNIRYTCY